MAQVQRNSVKSWRYTKVVQENFRNLTKICLLGGFMVGIFFPGMAITIPAALWGTSAVEPVLALSSLVLIPAAIIAPIIMIVLMIDFRKKNGPLPNEPLYLILYLVGIMLCEIPFLIWLSWG